MSSAGVRRIWVLVTQLPAEAALWREYKPPKPVETNVGKIASFFR